MSALQVEVGEIPISLRRKQLIVHYWANLLGHKDTHRTKQTVKTSWESNKIKKESFCVCVSELCKEFKVKEWNISLTVLISAVPPWLLPQPVIDLSLLKRLHSMKNKINVKAYVNTVLHEQYGQFIQIFTDGSKNPENGKTSCAFYVPELMVKVGKRASDHISH